MAYVLCLVGPWQRQHFPLSLSMNVSNHLINQYSSQTLKSYQAHMVNAIGCAWYLLLGKTS